MQTGKYRRFSFTWNNYTHENVKNLQNQEKTGYEYIIFGFEINETKHLQGYVEFKHPMTIMTAKSKLDPTLKKKSKIHIETSKGTQKDNIEYCSKTETTDLNAVKIYGKKTIEIGNRKQQGQRTDFHKVHEMIKDQKEITEIAEEHPEILIKYRSGVKGMIDDQKQKTEKEKLIDRYKNENLRLWQLKLLKMINKEPDDRTIIWIYDITGNKGKTWLANYLAATKGAIIFENAPCKDIAHAYNGEPIVIFDYVRSNESHINYQILESIKNGRIFSPKYDSKSKTFNTPHLIVFANWPPQTNKMSIDRWNIWTIEDIKNDLVHIPMIQDKKQNDINIETILYPLEIDCKQAYHTAGNTSSTSAGGDYQSLDNIETELPEEWEPTELEIEEMQKNYIESKIKWQYNYQNRN